MELARATNLAYVLSSTLKAACSRIEVVGSVKRGDKPEVHDIEILLIPNGKAPRPIFGMNPKNLQPTMLDQTLFDLRQSGILRTPARKADGPRYKKFAIVSESQLNEFCLDLFIVTERTWGIQNVIRTGPSLFSHCFVTPIGVPCTDHQTGKHYRGLLPLKYQYIKGETKIMEGSRELDLPEERDAIELLGLGWIEPKNRKNYVREIMLLDNRFK